MGCRAGVVTDWLGDLVRWFDPARVSAAAAIVTALITIALVWAAKSQLLHLNRERSDRWKPVVTFDTVLTSHGIPKIEVINVGVGWALEVQIGLEPANMDVPLERFDVERANLRPGDSHQIVWEVETLWAYIRSPDDTGERPTDIAVVTATYRDAEGRWFRSRGLILLLTEHVGTARSWRVKMLQTAERADAPKSNSGRTD